MSIRRYYQFSSLALVAQFKRSVLKVSCGILVGFGVSIDALECVEKEYNVIKAAGVSR